MNLHPNPFLLLIALIGGVETMARFHGRIGIAQQRDQHVEGSSRSAASVRWWRWASTRRPRWV